MVRCVPGAVLEIKKTINNRDSNHQHFLETIIFVFSFAWVELFAVLR